MTHERNPMLRATLLLALLAAATPAIAEDDLPGSTRPPDRERGASDLRLRAAGGAFDGMGVRRASGPIAFLELDWTPRFRPGDWEIGLPLRFDHRQTFGAHLDETIAGAGLDASWVNGGLKTGPIAGYSYTWRPGWPDLYQPDGAGGLLPTDRYTHSRWFAGWQLRERLGSGRHLHLKARWTQYDYVRDPNYDPALSVVHLAPRDYGELRFDASYRHVMHAFAWALRLDGYSRRYDVLLSKDAFTGGTLRSNPPQRLRGMEPRAEIQLRSRPIELTLGYGFPWQDDPYEGYYSYTGHHPYAEAKGAITEGLSYVARASARFLTYGPNSKSISSDGGGGYVPGTDDGKRLWDRRLELHAGLRYALVKGLSLTADAQWTRRDTNYRDYVPGVYPPTASRPYDIRWDYTNTLVTGGVEWKP